VGKQYYLLNKKVTPEQYEAFFKRLQSNQADFEKAFQRFEEIRAQRIFKFAEIVNCEECSGDFLRNSANCYDCYDVVDSRDCRYVQVGISCRDVIDCSNMYIDPELSYQTLGTIGTNNVHFCLYVFHSSNMWYCEQCFSCRDCFGCVGLRNKRWCILNKQYDAETYQQLAASIARQMQASGEWGCFFPAGLSPFPYNKSLAQEYFPLSMKEAEERGFRWEEPEPSEFKKSDVEISEAIQFVSDEICSQVLACQKTGRNYKIQKSELSFYRRMKLPVPRLCPDVRYERRAALRNPRRAWDRLCDHCGCDLKTSFRPGQHVKVLCENDYLAAVQ
jgi:hypothetical protein